MNLPHLRQYLWREWIRPLALPLLAIAAAKSAVADMNPVPTGSMKPTVLEGDVVLVNKLAYDLKVPFTTVHLARWADPARGDVVVCFSPSDGTRLLKRVVALPGDTVEMRQEVLFLNGEPLRYATLPEDTAALAHFDPRERDAAFFAEEHLADTPHTIMVLHRSPAARRNFGPVTVGAGQYFMLGDNRDNSQDSRSFGFVPRHAIVGEAVAIVASVDLAQWGNPRLDRFFSPLNPTR